MAARRGVESKKEARRGEVVELKKDVGGERRQ
jgi:hypothetical protein